MPFATNGAYTGVDIASALVDISESIRQSMSVGDNIADVTETSPYIQLAKASAVAPLERLSNDIGYMLSQAYIDGAIGINLDRFAEGFGQRRKTATRASGVIRVILKTTLSTPPEPDPWLPAGSMTFRGSNGRKFDILDAVSVDGSSILDITVRAQQVGPEGNIAADTISPTVTFNDTSVASRWNTNVDSFSNLLAFEGGTNTEGDLVFKTRIRNARSASESATVDGILFALDNRNIGVESADVLENKTMIGGQEDIPAQQEGTGTASETINGGALERIAFKLTPSDNRWTQHAGFVLDTDAAFIGDVALHEDASGEPGALIGTQFQAPSVDGAGASVLTTATFTTALASFYLDGTLPRDIWLVVTHVSGSGSFDGDTGGSAGDVKVYDGVSWVNDANINRGNVRIISGVPPKSVRVVALGGLDADVGEAIFASKAAGIEDDGLESTVVQDRQNLNHTINFDRPAEVPLYVNLIVKVRDDTFPATGGEDLIRDLTVAYIGGTDTQGIVHSGLAVSGDFVMDQLITQIGDPDNTDGFISIPTRQVDIVDAPVNTGDLTPTRGSIFRVDVADIDVTIQRV